MERWYDYRDLKHASRWALVDLQETFNFTPPLELSWYTMKLSAQLHRACSCLTEKDLELISEPTKKVIARVVDPSKRIFNAKASRMWEKFIHDQRTKMIR